MAALLETIEWWGYHLGYASRHSVLQQMREHPMQRFVDEDTRRLISKAVSSDLIAEITRRPIAGPGYVLTRRGEAELTR
jgi:hypothetical protein